MVDLNNMIKWSDPLIIFAFSAIVLVIVIVAIIAINNKTPFESLDVKVPIPPPMFLNAIAYASDEKNPSEITLKTDLTLKANCSETFDYIEKFIDFIPLSWAVTAIKYVIQVSGSSNAQIAEILNQLDEKQTKAVVVSACKKLRELLC